MENGRIINFARDTKELKDLINRCQGLLQCVRRVVGTYWDHRNVLQEYDRKVQKFVKSRCCKSHCDKLYYILFEAIRTHNVVSSKLAVNVFRKQAEANHARLLLAVPRSIVCDSFYGTFYPNPSTAQHSTAQHSTAQ